MKIRIFGSVGLDGCDVEGVIDIHSSEIAGMTPEEVDYYLNDYAHSAMIQHFETWYEVIDDV